MAEVNAMPGLLETPPMDIQAVHWLGCSSVTILELQGQNAFMRVLRFRPAILALQKLSGGPELRPDCATLLFQKGETCEGRGLVGVAQLAKCLAGAKPWV